MGIFADYQKWKLKVEKAIPAALMDEVREVVEKDFLETAQSEVYGTYSPILYQRRFGAGGIYDVGLITARLEGNKTLVMKQTAPPNSNYPKKATAIDWVESDEGVPGGRPFYAPLKSRTTPRAQVALVAGVNKRI